MMAKRAVLLVLCAVMVIIPSAPLVQSEPGTIHLIVKDEVGPPSTYAEEWFITPTEDGTWHGHVVNDGMKWLIIDVTDINTGELLIDREMYRYAVWGDEFDTASVSMKSGHMYMITATPNGPFGTSCTVEDVFEGASAPVPPVAAFSVSVDGLDVSVDASASYDPDGSIMSYDWDWNDGTTGTGETATHTYVCPETIYSAPSCTETVMVHPYMIIGWVLDSEGNPIPDCEVIITDARTGRWARITSDSEGKYFHNLGQICLYQDGDLIVVEAAMGTFRGLSEAYVELTTAFIQIDVSLEEDWLGPFGASIKLSVTDDDGLTSAESFRVILYP